MKYDLTAVITDRDNKPVLIGDKPATVSRAIVNVLDGLLDDERGMSGEDRLKRFMLATRIVDADGKPELSAEDVVLCKKVVGASYIPLMVGRIIPCLETAIQ